MNENGIEYLAAAEIPNLIDKDLLRDWFLAVFHDSEIVCSHCGQPLSDRASKSYLNYQITSCINCGKKVQFFKGTLFQNAKISPVQFVLLAAYLSLNVPIRTIAKSLDISVSSVGEWQKKINQYTAVEGKN